MSVIEIVDPRGSQRPTVAAMAPRRRTADVERIGFLSNEEDFMESPLHFRRYVRILEKALGDRLPHVEFHDEVKPVLSRAAEREQLERFLGCHAVINGLAK